jgi:hypothetical protein
MLRTLSLTASLAALALFACTAEVPPPAEAPEGSEEATAPAEVDRYGEALTVAEATPISAILADKEAWIGKTVRVEGTVVGVCEARGCWIEIGGPGEGEKLRFKVEDGVMVFPMSAKGSAVAAEGVWTKISYTVEELRALRAEAAAEAGEEFDPATVTEPFLAWQLKGLGAEVGA